MAPKNGDNRRLSRVALTIAIAISLACLIINAVVFPLVPVVVEVSSEQLYGDISGIDVGARPRGGMVLWLGVREDGCYYQVASIHRSTIYRSDRDQMAANLQSYIETSRSAVNERLPTV